jgi:RNA polymerase sigma-70 factor, ECF subfamily
MGEDERLRLILMCCHPALSQEAQVALTLRLLGGLSTGEVARSFLVGKPAMAQRLVPAKRKIGFARIPHRIPEEHEFPDRLRPVLAVVYLVYNAGFGGGQPSLCAEGIRLARILVALMPDEPEACGVLALLLLAESRRAARIAADGATVAETDWRRIVALYDELLALTPTPVIALNRAVAVAEVDGPAAALAAIDGLELDGYYPLRATRGKLLRRLGRPHEAAIAYERASVCADRG